jgi:outer membrane immunogenic protein
VQAGYNWQLGNWVYGLEADIQGSSQQDNKTCVLSCSAIAGAAYDARLPWLGTVRGRLGYSVGPSLFYVTGGYAYGEVKTKIAFTGAAISGVNFSDTRSGWTVGGGIETPFTLLGLFGPNWTTTTEYLYVDLGSSSDLVDFGGGVTAVSSTHVREHIFRTGLNYHFNAPVVTRY